MSERLVEKALAIVGDASKYQKVLLVFSTLIYIQITYMLLGSSFIFMNPVFKCSFSDEDVTEAVACPRISQCKIINDFTITAHAELYCDRQTQRNIIQSTLYIGSVLGLFIMNMLSDTKGRKFSFVISLGIANLGVLTLILGAYSKIVALMSISQIIIGFGGYSVMIIGYTLLSDFCQDKMRQKAILSMNGVWALAELSFFFFYNWYNLWYNYLVVVVLIPSLGLFLFSLFFLIETPVFLLTKKHDKKACVESLKMIAIYNNRSDSQIQQASALIDKAHLIVQNQLEQDRKNNKNKQHQSVFYIFKSEKYMKTIFIIAIVEITTNMYYYGVQFSLEQIGTNFGTNILLTGMIEAIGYFSFSVFVTKLPRKKGLFIFNTLAIVFGCLFLFGFVNNNKIISSIVLCMCRFINTYSQGAIPLLQNESFPSTLQSTGWGLIEGTSQIGSFLTPFIVSGVTNAQLNPILIICCVMLIFGLFPIKFIKQTLNKGENSIQDQQQASTKQSLLSENKVSSAIST